jgi:transaldolase
VDTEFDKRLEKVGTDEAKAVKGKAGIANARLAYQHYEKVFSGERWQTLADAGARPQRPLWASTGVKDPNYKDTMYVEELVAPGTVNTMPEATLKAVADHGEIRGDTVTGNYADAQETMDRIAALGIDYDDVVEVLEREGVQKFEASWGELLETVQHQLDQARPGQGADR